MDPVGLVALLACLSSVFAKVLFSMRIRSLRHTHEKESAAYQNAQKALHQASQKNKRLEAELKHLENRRRSMDRNLELVKSTLEDLMRRKTEDDAVRAVQKALIQGGQS